MLIWGSKGKTKVKSSGVFICPRCNSKQRYKYHVAGKYFTLYFIPLFKTRTLGEYIECQNCFMTFKPEVLNWSNGRAQAEREINDFLDKVKDQLDSGVPVQLMLQALMENGLDEEQGTQIIFEASQGNIKKCINCQLVYSGKLSYCQQCGSKLITA